MYDALPKHMHTERLFSRSTRQQNQYSEKTFFLSFEKFCQALSITEYMDGIPTKNIGNEQSNS